MNHSAVEVDGVIPANLNTLEDAFKAIWERTRLASEVISQLKSEKQALAESLTQLEKEVSGLRTELSTREHELKKIRSEHAQLQNMNGKRQGFTEEEREILKAKIRDVIAKINSHL